MNESILTDTYLRTQLTDNRKRLHELLLEKKRRLGKKDLHYLCKEILGFRDLTDKDGFHGDYCRHLEHERLFKLTLTPRGTLKSSIGTVGGSIKDIINNPNIRILIASEKFTISTKFLGAIKSHLESPDFIKLYGDLKSKKKWSESEIVVNTRTHTWLKEPTISCAGVDVTKVGMHYDVIRVDDPHSDQNTTNQEQIDKVIRWYKLLLSLLDPGGKLYITGTIWHYGDLYNYIQQMERERVEKGRKKRFKIFKRDSFEGTVEELMDNKITKDRLLWPERLSAEFLQDQYLEQGPYIFSCQYRLNPVDDENATFKYSWLKGIDPKDVPKNIKFFAAVDPMVDEEGKDFLAIPVVGFDRDWNGYIFDCINRKADEHDTVDAMHEVQLTFRPQKIGMEANVFQETYYKYIKMLQMMQGYKLPMEEIKNSNRVTKRQRIKGLVPWFKAGLFKIVCEDGDIKRLKGGMATLIDQLTRFPKTTNDDCIDGLANINKLSNRPGLLQILKKRNPAGSFMEIRKRHLHGKKNRRLGRHNIREKRYGRINK